MLAVQAGGRSIETVERLAQGEQMSRGRAPYVHFLGGQLECGVDLGGNIRVLNTPFSQLTEGDLVVLRVDRQRCTAFPCLESS